MLISGRPVASLALLMATVAVEGTLVMVLEIIGARVIGPFFGVSLFIWTALIAVTLLSLACGYALGGIAADRWRRPAGVYAIIMAAGMLVLVNPLVQPAVIQAATGLGLRGGALAASAALFLPPLLLLGMVSPYVIRLAAADFERIGRTVGLFYAVSTLGSVTGTVVTGFLLIDLLGVKGIFALVGGTLVGVGVLYFLLAGPRLLAAAGAASWLLVGLYPAGGVVAHTHDGTRVALIDNVDTFYGSLRIVDYTHPTSAVHLRELLIDGLVQGGVDIRDGRSIYAFTELATALPGVLAEDAGPREMLAIGLGAGVAVRNWSRAGHAVDVVEINPAVVRLSGERFGALGARTVYNVDARRHLAVADRTYDVVFLDVFGGDVTPGSLLSAEALGLAKRRLKPDGLLLVNLVGRLSGDTRMTASIGKTVAASFQQVAYYPLFDPADPQASGNMILVAHDGPPRPAPPGALARAAAAMHPLTRGETRWLAPVGPPTHPRAVLLTDDYNPLDLMDLDLREALREGIISSTPAAILMAQSG